MGTGGEDRGAMFGVRGPGWGGGWRGGLEARWRGEASTEDREGGGGVC